MRHPAAARPHKLVVARSERSWLRGEDAAILGMGIPVEERSRLSTGGSLRARDGRKRGISTAYGGKDHRRQSCPEKSTRAGEGRIEAKRAGLHCNQKNTRGDEVVRLGARFAFCGHFKQLPAAISALGPASATTVSLGNRQIAAVGRQTGGELVATADRRVGNCMRSRFARARVRRLIRRSAAHTSIEILPARRSSFAAK